MERYNPYEFGRWVRGAQTGDRIIYHVGFLAQDRLTYLFVEGPDGTVQYIPFPPVDEVANRAYYAWQSGKVHLFQRKLGENTYGYIAERR